MIAEEQRKLDLQDTSPVESVEEYRFKHPPIRGFPELRWNGKRPFTSTQYYPAQHKETHGPEVKGWRNKIYWGDNLQVMSHLLKEFRGKVQLVYIDPPFDSKADYKKRVKLRGQQLENDQGAFEEKQYTDIWTNDEYLQFMYERLILIRELMSDNGSIYLHCDSRKNHHLKAIMEEVFGPSNLRSEVIWKRTSAHSDSGGYAAIHDTLLFFSKTDSYTWTSPQTEYEDWYVERYYRYTDDDGRRFKSGDLSASGLSGGGYSYTWKGVDGYWRCPQSTMEELDKQGLIYYTSNGIPRRKQYLDEMKGRDVQSLWDDIQPVVSWSTEQTGYPTQKPEALIERIIQASSRPGDLVFDCFMGSGTTQAVAMKLGRRFIGTDINLGAVQITTKRLLSVGKELEAQKEKAKQPKLLESQQDDTAEPTNFFTGFEVYNVNHYDIFRNPVEAKALLLEALEVNRLGPGHVFDGEKDGRMVKLMPVNRIATRADLNDLLANLDYRALEKRQKEHPNRPVERITLVCMGHEPDLGAVLESEVKQNGFSVDVQVVDILRDKQELQFKRDSEAKVVVQDGQLVIKAFYPMNLLSKLSLQAENVEDWREMVESVMVDWNYDGAVLEPALVDVPEDDALVEGSYAIPEDAGTIRVKITDLLSESLEVEVAYG